MCEVGSWQVSIWTWCQSRKGNRKYYVFETRYGVSIAFGKCSKRPIICQPVQYAFTINYFIHRTIIDLVTSVLLGENVINTSIDKGQNWPFSLKKRVDWKLINRPFRSSVRSDQSVHQSRHKFPSYVQFENSILWCFTSLAKKAHKQSACGHTVVFEESVCAFSCTQPVARRCDMPKGVKGWEHLA